MTDGQEIWKTFVCNVGSGPTTVTIQTGYSCDVSGADIGALAAHNGVVIGKAYGRQGGGSIKIMGFNGTNGAFLWEYTADRNMWNPYPTFTDDGKSFLFQDSQGGVYRLGINGELIWKNSVDEQWDSTWTDGGTVIG